MGMFDSIGSALGISTDAVTGGIGSLFSAGMGILGANQQQNANVALMNQANAFSAAQADKQMQFQKDMRASQYQTAVEDLQKAGLNPMLAYSQGGAGNLAGASAASISPQPAVNKLSGIISNAQHGATFGAAIQQAHLANSETISRIGVNDEDRRLKDAQTLSTLESIPVSKALVKEKLATEKSLLNGIRLQNSSIGLNAAHTANIGLKSDIIRPDAWAASSALGGNYGKIRTIGSDIARGVNSAASAASNLRGRSVNINNPTYNKTQYLEKE